MQQDQLVSRSVSAIFMDTVVTIDVIGPQSEPDFRRHTAAAFGWFAAVEECCSRFNLGSELMQLCSRIGEPIAVSPLLYQATEFAIAVAEASGGAFDPAIGRTLEKRGFNVNYLTGENIHSPGTTYSQASYRDVILDPGRQTIMLNRPLTLDLGAVAKGLAIDLAARELACVENYVIDAGGDIWAAGSNEQGRPWHIGLRDPSDPERVVAVLGITNAAVCTSAGYERPRLDGQPGHHIIDPRSTESPVTLSATVIAPSAMVADALSTAAFVLGSKGIPFLEAQGVEGSVTTASRQRCSTSGFTQFEL